MIGLPSAALSAWTARLALAGLLLVLLMRAGAPPPATAVSTTVVINEVDYDQPGTDTAEFVELKNVSGGPVNLDNYVVELVNGIDGGAAVYKSIDLPNASLPAGDYYVVCGDSLNVANCDLVVSPASGLIQNGSPDAVGLKEGTTLVDAVSYEGDTAAPYTESSGVGVDDPGTGSESIARCPDGADTDANSIDFSAVVPTPGATNACGPVGGVAESPVLDAMPAAQEQSPGWPPWALLAAALTVAAGVLVLTGAVAVARGR